ncbi:MAG: 50S ribosomal protein L17 [Candidatus Chisholmbacteria bacterium]|nr:50S ribosomal protein L17 [Candidatus Chisholmbacteria bacterium]
MKHRYAGGKFGRTTNQRKALFKNLISALILKGKIYTTEAKAKAVKRLVDTLVTKAKKRTLGARRLVGAFLQNKAVVNKLVDEIAPRFKNRLSGMTSFERVTRRRGDGAVMVELKLLDQPEEVEVKPEARVSKKEKIIKKKKSVSQKPKPVKVTQKRPLRETRVREAAQIQKRGLSK